MIPDRLPQLARGAHDAGSGELCLEEMVAWIAAEPHSDTPKCVHPIFWDIGQMANDHASDETLASPGFIMLGLRQIGTATVDPQVTDALYRSVDLFWTGKYPTTRVAWADFFRRLLEATLDEYDRLTGRTGVPEVSPADWQRMLVAAGAA